MKLYLILQDSSTFDQIQGNLDLMHLYSLVDFSVWIGAVVTSMLLTHNTWLQFGHVHIRQETIL